MRKYFEQSGSVGLLLVDKTGSYLTYQTEEYPCNIKFLKSNSGCTVEGLVKTLVYAAVEGGIWVSAGCIFLARQTQTTIMAP